MKAIWRPHLWECFSLQGNWHVSCGSGACPRRKPGIPAAMIDAESLTRKKRTYRLMT
jgi:hypothetical protein